MTQRDYSSISPSARALLQAKALTDIPYMADAARLVRGAPIPNASPDPKSKLIALMRLLHFEARYKSLDRMLEELGSTHIFEISSGFSFRGLHLAVNRPGVFYIDTDLPGIIADKQQLIAQLMQTRHLQLRGDLATHELNALDEAGFFKLLSLMPQGPVTIINEGLLMYLANDEKIKMCRIIHRALKQYGGYWATADIYVKKELQADGFQQFMMSDDFSKFLSAHHVEENKFDSFEQAARFFNEQGFKIYKKAEKAKPEQLSALKYLDSNMLRGYLPEGRTFPHIRETWVLEAV